MSDPIPENKELLQLWFTPYDGKEPFFFISYRHVNSARVIPIIRRIHEQKYRLWYDEGIPAGANWSRNIDLHMKTCSCVIFFLSKTFYNSPNCKNELIAALQQKKKILFVLLDNAPFPDEWKHFEISDRESVSIDPKTVPTVPQMSDDRDYPAAILQKLEQEKELDLKSFLGDGISGYNRVNRVRENKKLRGFLIGFISLFAAALGYAIYIIRTTPPPPPPPPTATVTPTATATATSTPITPTATATATNTLTPTATDTPLPTDTATPTATNTPTPTATATETPTPTPKATSAYKPLIENGQRYINIQDELTEKAIRKALNDESEEPIPEERLDEIEVFRVGGKNRILKEKDRITFDDEGNCLLNSAPLLQGPIRDITLFTQMKNLRELSLCCQSLSNISQLCRSDKIEVLNLSGNPMLSDIRGLEGMEHLKELNLEHTGVHDLTPLCKLPALESVTVSADMVPLVWDPDAAFRVVLIK